MKQYINTCWHKTGQWLHYYWPRQIQDPVFIVGAPRSGTTILGKILGTLPGCFYLHEPRYIWCSVNPDLDIWGYTNPSLKEGVLQWGAKDVNVQETDRLARWFQLELDIHMKRRLIEKLPINVYRMRWLHAMFPKAKFIHIIRHGRDVALSFAREIVRWSPPGVWETSRGYGRIIDYAATKPQLRPKLHYMTKDADNYARGLLVWVCAVSEGCQTGAELGTDFYLKIHYEDLISEPEKELQCIFHFLNEPVTQNVIRYAKKILYLHAFNQPDPNPALTKVVAGTLLDAFDYTEYAL